MNAFEVIKILTPDDLELDGIWYGPPQVDTVLVWVHGLGGNAFSQFTIKKQLVNKQTAVLTFNNRGSGLVSGFVHINKEIPKGYDYRRIGKAHEVFTECVLDIEGAIKVAETRGVKRVILVGHSTGTQKCVYYLSRKHHELVKGAVLLAPVSDVADMVKFTPSKVYSKLVAVARKLVESGKPHQLMPEKLWPSPTDAQRFLSLFTPESTEEIFGYATGKKPLILQKVKVPQLLILAELDDYRDRPMVEIGNWFRKALAKQIAQVEIISGANHSFTESTGAVAKLIKKWLVSASKL